MWFDPFIGYQAFDGTEPLSHLDIYQRFMDGLPVQFLLIESAWPGAILTKANYQGYRSASCQATFYTPLDSLCRSANFGDRLSRLPLPKAIRKLVLYFTVKLPLLAAAKGFNYFLLVMARLAALACCRAHSCCLHGALLGGIFPFLQGRNCLQRWMMTTLIMYRNLQLPF